MTKRLARRQFVHIAVNQWINQIVHELTLLGCHYVRQITCSDACFVEHNVERQHFLRLLPEPEAVLCELLAVGVTTNRITAKHRGQRTQPINEARVLIHCLGVINVKVQMAKLSESTLSWVIFVETVPCTLIRGAQYIIDGCFNWRVSPALLNCSTTSLRSGNSNSSESEEPTSEFSSIGAGERGKTEKPFGLCTGETTGGSESETHELSRAAK